MPCSSLGKALCCSHAVFHSASVVCGRVSKAASRSAGRPEGMLHVSMAGLKRLLKTRRSSAGGFWYARCVGSREEDVSLVGIYGSW